MKKIFEEHAGKLGVLFGLYTVSMYFLLLYFIEPLTQYVKNFLFLIASLL